MLDGEEAPKCGPCRSGSRRDDQRAIFAAERLGAAQIEVVWNIDALALDRLDDEGGHLPPREGFFQSGEIVEGYFQAVRSSEPKPSRKVMSPFSDKGAIRQAMKGVVAIDDAGAAGGAAGEFERGFDGL